MALYYLCLSYYLSCLFYIVRYVVYRIHHTYAKDYKCYSENNKQSLFLQYSMLNVPCNMTILNGDRGIFEICNFYSTFT